MHAVQLPIGVHPCPCQTTSSCNSLSAGLEDRSDLVLSASEPGARQLSLRPCPPLGSRCKSERERMLRLDLHRRSAPPTDRRS